MQFQMRRSEIAARLDKNVSKSPLTMEDEVEYYLDVRNPSSRQPRPRSVA